jgi:hypothetical protein
MKIETAEKILRKEAIFVGMDPYQLVRDIQSMKNPLMVYSKKVVEASQTISRFIQKSILF